MDKIRAGGWIKVLKISVPPCIRHPRVLAFYFLVFCFFHLLQARSPCYWLVPLASYFDNIIKLMSALQVDTHLTFQG